MKVDILNNYLEQVELYFVCNIMPPQAKIFCGIFSQILVASMTAVLVEEVSILILLLLSALSATEMSSHARMSDTIRGTRFCSVNIYKSVPKIPNFQSLGDRQNKQLINSKQTSNDKLRTILP